MNQLALVAIACIILFANVRTATAAATVDYLKHIHGEMYTFVCALL